MTRHDDDPDFLPPHPADLPEPAAPSGRDDGGRGEPPSGPPLPGPPLPGPPLPAESTSARDDGRGGARHLKTAMIIAIPLLLVAIVALAGVVVVHLGDSLRSHVAQGLTSSPRPTPSGPAATIDPPRPTRMPTKAPAKAVVAGWQPVVHAKRGVAYDVPRAWEVNSADTIVGFEGTSSGRTLAMTGSAEYGSGYCTNDSSGVWRAVAGVAAAPKSGSLAAATKKYASVWGNVYDEPSKGIHAVADPGRVRPLRVKGARAYRSRVRITVTGGDACTPDRALAEVVVIRGPHTNGAFVLVSDQGDEPDPRPGTLARIASSVRVYHH